jgi:hypothetical protein
MSRSKKTAVEDEAVPPLKDPASSAPEAAPGGRLTEGAVETETPAAIAAPVPDAVAQPRLELPRHWPATILVMVVAAFGIGGLSVYWPRLTGGGDQTTIGALEARIAALEGAAPAQGAAAGANAAFQRRVESAETRISTLERNAPSIFNPQAGATLDQRVTTLETARSEITQAQAALIARLNSVEAAVPADLPQRLQSFALGASLSQVESRVTQLEALRNAAAVLALARLARAADEAQPYAREYRALQTVAPDDPAIAVLGPHAETGIPTMAMLSAQFPDVAREAISAERTGLADGFWSRLWARFRNLVSIRRIVLDPGDDTESRLGRAQALIAGGDFPAATEEVGLLTGHAATSIEPWLSRARARIAIDRAITEMDDRVTQALALRVPPPVRVTAPAQAAAPAAPATRTPAVPATRAPGTAP